MVENPVKWKVDTKGKTTTLFLSGEIGENAHFVGVKEKIPISSTVVIDTGDIVRITSVGVRTWVEFMHSLQGRDITLTRCSPAIVAQLNTVFNFRGTAQVCSVVAPFYCSHCDSESSELVEIQANATEPHKIIQTPFYCSSCSNEKEFDDLPDRYFLFIRLKA